MAASAEERSNMLEILENGDYPVAELTRDAQKNVFTIRYVPRTAGYTSLRYMAISHVWADGLGNKQGHALRCFRLSHLFKCTSYPAIEKKHRAYMAGYPLSSVEAIRGDIYGYLTKSRQRKDCGFRNYA